MAESVTVGLRATTALGFVAGFVDSVGFISLGFFPAHITGNFVLVGEVMAELSDGFLIRFIAFVSFMVAVAFTEAILHWQRKRSILPFRAMLLLEILLTGGFGLLGHLAVSPRPADLALAYCAAAFGAGAMGLQSAGVQRILAGPTTTAMTGNVTRLVLELTGLWLRGGDDAQRRDIGRLALLVGGFGFGAIAGALGVVHAGFAALALPLAVMAATLVRIVVAGAPRSAGQEPPLG